MSLTNAKPLYNVYCDESCHLEHDNQPIMAFGATWCPQDQARRLGAELRDIKTRHRARGELKWAKVSDSGVSFYLEPDFRRAERLPWARPMLDNVGQAEILNWDYEEGDGDIHTYVWLKDFDYLIVMKRYKDGRRRLITAFWLEYESKRRGLLKKYARRRA